MTQINKTKHIIWNRDDTPIPRKNQILTNIFNEKWKVIRKIKGDETYELFLELQE